MINGMSKASEMVRDLGATMWESGPSGGYPDETVASTFAELGDWSAVAFELVSLRYPEK